MHLDLLSIYAVAAVTGCVIGAVQLLSFTTRRFGRWLLWWGMSNVLIGGGGFCVMQQGLGGSASWVVCGNVANLAGYALLVAGMRDFAARAFRPRTIVLAVAVAALVPLLWRDPGQYQGRVALLSLLLAACDSAIIWEAIRTARIEGLKSAWIMVGLFMPTAISFLGQAYLGATGRLGGDTLFARGGGAHAWFVVGATAIIILRGMTLFLLAAERSNRKLETLAYHDPLTGTLNRNGLFETIGRYAQAHAGKSVGDAHVLLVDIDHFKGINDRFGHVAGDAVLRKFGTVARAVLRPQDFVARVGGDEFVIVMPDTLADHAKLLAEAIRTGFATAAPDIAHQALAPTLSIGMSTGSLTADTMDILLHRADRALYAAKHQGRDRTVSLAVVAPSELRGQAAWTTAF
jgi:diguanylate cyclase (GGDEF)-like protein